MSNASGDDTPSVVPEELEVRWMDNESTETEWYFNVMEPLSRGIMRRGCGCYIKKSIAYDQPSVKNAASTKEAEWEAMSWARNEALDMAVKCFSVIKGGVPMADERMEIKPVSASGDDEELKEALKNLRVACAQVYLDDYHSGVVDDAEAKVESLFGRIREERDRLRKDNERLNMGDGYQRGVLYALHHNDGTWGVYAIMGSADIWFSQAVTRCNHTSCSNAWKEFYDLPDEVQRLRGGALKEGATQ